ncbi:CAP domain-containing protein [Micromonospora sp. DT201]|uniref:CAP domain-containing protein n=1 Tax=Micromonospora sp. DT201 TaxID=3393442 RepID=UPI003CF71B42
MPKSKGRKRRDGSAVAFRGAANMTTAPHQMRPHEAEEDDDYLFSSGGTAHTRSAQPAVSIGRDTYRTHLENTVVHLTNQVRAKAGVPPLKLNELLRQAARSHSTDMARRGFFSHIDPDGGTPFDRMRSHGYAQPGAENVAMGQSRPHEVIHAWLNSPGHRANILNPEFSVIGVGLHLDGGPWWTQNFGYA